MQPSDFDEEQDDTVEHSTFDFEADDDEAHHTSDGNFTQRGSGWQWSATEESSTSTMPDLTPMEPADLWFCTACHTGDPLPTNKGWICHVCGSTTFYLQHGSWAFLPASAGYTTAPPGPPRQSPVHDGRTTSRQRPTPPRSTPTTKHGDPGPPNDLEGHEAYAESETPTLDPPIDPDTMEVLHPYRVRRRPRKRPRPDDQLMTDRNHMMANHLTLLSVSLMYHLMKFLMHHLMKFPQYLVHMFLLRLLMTIKDMLPYHLAILLEPLGYQMVEKEKVHLAPKVAKAMAQPSMAAAARALLRGPALAKEAKDHDLDKMTGDLQTEQPTPRMQNGGTRCLLSSPSQRKRSLGASRKDLSRASNTEAEHRRLHPSGATKKVTFKPFSAGSASSPFGDARWYPTCPRTRSR